MRASNTFAAAAVVAPAIAAVMPSSPLENAAGTTQYNPFAEADYNLFEEKYRCVQQDSTTNEELDCVWDKCGDHDVAEYWPEYFKVYTSTKEHSQSVLCENAMPGWKKPSKQCCDVYKSGWGLGCVGTHSQLWCRAREGISRAISTTTTNNTTSPQNNSTTVTGSTHIGTKTLFKVETSLTKSNANATSTSVSTFSSTAAAQTQTPGSGSSSVSQPQATSPASSTAGYSSVSQPQTTSSAYSAVGSSSDSQPPATSSASSAAGSRSAASSAVDVASSTTVSPTGAAAADATGSAMAKADVEALIKMSAEFKFTVQGGLCAITDMPPAAAAVSWRLVYHLEATAESKFSFEICEPSQAGRVVTKVEGQYVFGLAVNHKVTATGYELVCDTGSLQTVKVENKQVVSVTSIESSSSVQAEVAVYQCANIRECNKSTCTGDKCAVNLIAKAQPAAPINGAITTSASAVASISWAFEQCKSKVECSCVQSCVGEQCGPVQKPTQGPAPVALPTEKVHTIAVAAIAQAVIEVNTPGAQGTKETPGQPQQNGQTPSMPEQKGQSPSKPQQVASGKPSCIPRPSQGPAAVAPVSGPQQVPAVPAPAPQQGSKAAPQPVGSVATQQGSVAGPVSIPAPASNSAAAPKVQGPASVAQPNAVPANKIADVQGNVQSEAVVKISKQATNGTGQAAGAPAVAAPASIAQSRPANGTGAPVFGNGASGRVVVAFNILAGVVGIALFL